MTIQFNPPHFLPELLNAQRGGYAVLVMTLRRRYVNRRRRNNPEFANLRIVVVPRGVLAGVARLDGPELAAALGLKHAAHYLRVMREEGLFLFDKRADAQAKALELRNAFRKAHRKARIHGDGEANHRVYCVLMLPSVWADAGFKRANPQGEGAAFYVGQTCHAALHRLLQHVNPSHRLHSKWGVHYFPGTTRDALALGLEAGMAAARRWSLETGRPLEGLTRFEALQAEADLTAYLRSLGFGAYSA